MDDRRNLPRITVTQLAAVARAEGGWWQAGRTIDLSLSGLALEFPAYAGHVGEEVQVALSVQNRLVTVSGRAVRVAGSAATVEVAIALRLPERSYLQSLALVFADQAPMA